MLFRLFRIIVLACAFRLFSASLQAQYLYESFVEPSWIATEEPNAEFSQWDNFYRANGTNFPDMDAPFGVQSTASAAGATPPPTTSSSDPTNPIAYWNNNNPTITQTAGGAFIIGPAGGNVYSFSNPTAFRLNDILPFTLGTVVFQFQTEGNLFDKNSLLLVYNNGGGNVSIAPAQLIQEYAASASSFGGLSSRVAAQWNLAGLGITTYQILWNASASSMSFQRALLDTTSISGSGVPRAGNFTGASGTSWATLANWQGSLPPDNAANVRFSSGSSVTLDTSRMVGEVTFATPGNFTLNASGGAVLTVNTGFTVTNVQVNTVTAPVKFGGFNLITVGSGATLDMQAAISGNSGLQKSGAGTLMLHANNTFAGGLTLDGGTLEIFGNNTYGNGTFIGNGTLVLHRSAVSGAGSLGSGFAPVSIGEADTVGTNAQLWLNGDLMMVRNVNFATGTDAKTLGASGTSATGATYSGTLVIETSADNVRFSTQSASDVLRLTGASAGGNGDKTVHVTGPGTVIYANSTKSYSSATSVDTGKLQLAANTSFTGTGAFAVAASAHLQVNGNLAGGGTLSVAGNLSGSGFVQRATTLQPNALVSPGDGGVGMLSFGSNLHFSNSTVYRWEIQSPSLTAGVGWDLLHINGAVNFNGTVGQPIVIRLATVDANGQPGLAAGFISSQDYDWVIAEWFGGMTSTGFFAMDEIEFINPTPGSFSLNINAGQQLVLHYDGVAIPEPAQAALLLGICTAALIRHQRRKLRHESRHTP